MAMAKSHERISHTGIKVMHAVEESSRERVIDVISRGFSLDVERRGGRQWFGRSGQGPEDVDET